MNPSSLETQVQLMLATASDCTVRIQARFSYVHTDPYAVRLSLHIAPERVVHWTFARELLDEGMDTPAGIGDVKIIPTESCTGENSSLNLSLQTDLPALKDLWLRSGSGLPKPMRPPRQMRRAFRALMNSLMMY